MPERKKPTLTLVKKGKRPRKGKSAPAKAPGTPSANQTIVIRQTIVDEEYEPENYIEGRLDLNRYLVKHPTMTFYARVSSDSMTGRRIYPGSLLVVDSAVEPVDGDVVIARINSELCVRQLQYKKGRTFLVPRNRKYEPIEMTDNMDCELWGRVMFVISQP